jgi:opacity protein-like surface antigen
MTRFIVFLAAILLFMSLLAAAQESRSEISVQGAGFFTNNTSGNGINYRATETAGVLGTYRYRLSRRISIEGAYGITRDAQEFAESGGSFRVPSYVHQATGAVVMRLPGFGRGKLSPYILFGGGATIFDPQANSLNSVSGAQTQTRGTFVYGAGFDYAIAKQLSLRMEYRGLVYAPPDFGFTGITTNSTTQTAVPSVGVAYRF